MPWRTTNGNTFWKKGLPELPTLIEGVFEQQRFLDLLRHFTVFGETGSGLAKIVAGYHQYHAVNRAVESTIRAADPWQGVHEEPSSTVCPAWPRNPQG
jgi:type I restriction enzyme R subunit